MAEVRDQIQTKKEFNPESFSLPTNFLTYIAGVTQKEKSDFFEIYPAAVQCVEYEVYVKNYF